MEILDRVMKELLVFGVRGNPECGSSQGCGETEVIINVRTRTLETTPRSLTLPGSLAGLRPCLWPLLRDRRGVGWGRSIRLGR